MLCLLATWLLINLNICHFQLMFYKHRYKHTDFISVYNTEECILKFERCPGISVHFYLVTFWWWLWTTGVKCSHPSALPRTKSGLWDWPWPSCAALPASAAGRICPPFLWIPSSHLPLPRQTGGGVDGRLWWHEKIQHCLSLEFIAQISFKNIY